MAKFDTQTGTWSALRDGANSGPNSGSVYSVAKSGDHIYVGGFLLGDPTAQRYIRRYNVVTKKWEVDSMVK